LSRSNKNKQNISDFKHLSPQNILLTGATGFLGKALCRVLLNQGHRLTLLARDFSKAAEISDSRVTLIASLDCLANDDHFDCVINLAGESIAQRWSAARKKALFSSRVELTRQLVAWMANAKHPPATLISASAIGFYGTQDETRLDENSKAKDCFAHQLCRDWESAAMAAEALGVRVVLLRSGIVLGAHGGALLKMLSPFSLGLGGQLGNGQQWMSWIHLQDWIGITLHVMQCNNLSGPVNLTAPAPVSNKEFTKTLGQALRRPTLMTLPAFVVKLLFGEMGEELLLRGQHVLPAKIQSLGYQFRYPSLAPAIKEVVSHG
jgi:hypothetical protein